LADAFKKVTASVAEICAQLPLGEEALALRAPNAGPADFLAAIVDAALYADAVRFLTRGLPKREAVWWACLCARDALPPDTPPPVEAALKAAEAWVYKPEEENRRAAMTCADAAKFDSPSSWAAMGAFWSGGSMAPPGLPIVPPGQDLTAAAVTGAIMLAAVQSDPAKADERYRRFLAYGVDIAEGGTGRKKPAA
jgi:hypothetical protein